MSMNPARQKLLEQLSQYVDGELSPEERQQVEQHLAYNKESASLVADFRAADGVIRLALEHQGDDLDWKEFTNGVMGKVVPERLPFWGRIKLSLSEMFEYQRGTLVAGMVGAAAAIAIAVPISIQLAGGAPDGYANGAVEVQTVSVEENATVRPVVMETEGGDAVIWTVDDRDGGKKKRRGGDEEDLRPSPPAELKQHEGAL